MSRAQVGGEDQRTSSGEALGDGQGVELLDRVSEALKVHRLELVHAHLAVRRTRPALHLFEEGVQNADLVGREFD